MDTMSQALQGAAALIASGDAVLARIVLLSLKVSLSAVALATLFGLPIGASIAIGRFPGRRALVILLNALMGLPPVVVGLLVYLLLSRAGPLGEFGLLFTPGAMVVAQTILVLPIVAALCRQAAEDAWTEYEEQLRSLGASGLDAALTLVWEIRFSLVTAIRAGQGARRGRRGDHRWRKHRWRHARDDHDDRPGNVQGRPGACALAGVYPDPARRPAERGGIRHSRRCAAALRVMRAAKGILPLRLREVSLAVGGRSLLERVSVEIEAGPA